MSIASHATLSAVISNAKRASQRRNQRLTTGHLLLVMLQQGGETARLLSIRGLKESELTANLRTCAEEPLSAVDLCIETAQRMAAERGELEARPLHLLFALVREPRTAAYKLLERLGIGMRIHDDLVARIGSRSERRSSEPPIAKTPIPAKPNRPVAPVAPAPLHLVIGSQATPDITRQTQKGRYVPPQRGKKLTHQSQPQEQQSQTQAQPVAPTPETVAPPQMAAHASTRRAGRRTRKDDPKPEVLAQDLLPAELALDKESFPVLSAIGRNLTMLAALGDLDPVVAREQEIEQLLDILARRRSNNPILVGAPGVGKTAIVEGLAQRLAAGGDGVHGLTSRIVIEVSAGALVAGTGVRGAVAERMQKLKDEVLRAAGRVLLFIDEIHCIVGGDGPDDLAQELKTALARGELPCIGATTEAEYRKHIERDPALARRFQRVVVTEPDAESTKRVLQGLQSRYEIHHGVAYTDEALFAAVDLSVRYLTEQALPDKAISIMDWAGARVRRRGGQTVGLEDVANVVSEQARVPLERLMTRDQERYLQLENVLAERVVGHPKELSRIADSLRKGAAGFRGQRPLGTFLFLGPTGVGKTETAKAIAEAIFPAGAFTRIDMTEYSEPHAVAKLIGAPPGYVGYDAGGLLTEAVRKRPYQLLLLDEIEKAHPEVLLALLPLLDEGRLTDSRGRTVDFSHTVVCMTSNLGADAAVGPGPIGFNGDAAKSDAEESKVLKAVKNAMPPELWNRIDEPLYFRALERSDVRRIAARLFNGFFRTLLSEHQITATADDSVYDMLLEQGGYEARYGARPMRRVFSRAVESKIASSLLNGDLTKGAVIRMTVREGALAFVTEQATFATSDIAAAE